MDTKSTTTNTGPRSKQPMSALAKSCQTSPILDSEGICQTLGPNPITTYKTPRELIESPEWAGYDKAYPFIKINCQQMAKSPILLDCLIPEDGHVFVQMDYTSLEPYVLAEFSGCPTYKEVYASGKPHDVYFYVTCKLLDDDGQISAVYNPENPTPESVKAAKKQFKPQRNVGKVFQLMSTYKAGAPKIHRKLRIMNFDFSLEEVKAIRERYWGPELFGAVMDYEQDLLTQVTQNNGYFVNGTGRPMIVTERKEKDVVNTFCQSTGHDNLDLTVRFFEQQFQELGLHCFIPVVEDYHDETVWQAPVHRAEDALQYIRNAVAKTNELIQYKTPLVGEPEIAYTFTDFKQPDPVDWYTEKCNE